MEKTLKALGDPVRREILKLLKQGTMNVGQIARHFSISDATLSYHLGILKAAQLVVEERQGNFRYYTLHASVFEELIAFLYQFYNKENPDENQKS